MLAGSQATEKQGYILGVGGIGGSGGLDRGGRDFGTRGNWRCYCGGVDGIGRGGHGFFPGGSGGFGFGVRLGASGEQEQGGGQEPKRGGAEEHYIEEVMRNDGPLKDPMRLQVTGGSCWRTAARDPSGVGLSFVERRSLVGSC